MPTQSDTLANILKQDIVRKSDLCDGFDTSPRTIERWVRLRELPQPDGRIGRHRIWTGRRLRKHFGLESA